MAETKKSVGTYSVKVVPDFTSLAEAMHKLASAHEDMWTIADGLAKELDRMNEQESEALDGQP